MDLLDLNPRITTAIKRANIDGVAILSMSEGDLARELQLSKGDITILKSTAAKSIYKQANVTALDMYGRNSELITHLSSGCDILDQFLHGGFLCPGINEICGESACGKTQLCLQLCLTVQRATKLRSSHAGALYICTEDVFPNKRLMQMIPLFKTRHPEIDKLNFTDNIFIEHASDLDDLWYILLKKLPVLLNQRNVKLVIIDSIAALFRCENLSGTHRASRMNNFGAILHKLSKQHMCTVLCVNQITANVGKGSTKRSTVPSLGLLWGNWVTVRLMMHRTHQSLPLPQTRLDCKPYSKAEMCVRDIEVVFAPHLPNDMCKFVVSNEGVMGVSLFEPHIIV